MLTSRRVLSTLIATAAMALTLAVVAAPAAYADGKCPVDDPYCTVDGNQPPSPPPPGGGGGSGGGGGGSGGGTHVCHAEGKVVPCYLPDYGWLNEQNGCYYKIATDMGDNGAYNGGYYYDITCGAGSADGTYVFLGTIWYQNPPPGFGGNAGPTPEQLAQQALAKIKLLGADIGVAPQPGGAGAVGLPVWLWTAVTPSTWGPITASATSGTLTVTITGHATSITWNMGDGNSVTCANPGTPYSTSYGKASSPTCGYRYDTPSRDVPGGRYAITATTTWRVDWAGGGQNGVITTTRTSRTTVRIDEIQVVTQ